MTETPITPIVVDGWGVSWGVTSGGPDTGDDIINLSDSLPGQEPEQPDYFNTKFKWDSVELKYVAIGEDYEPLGRFKIGAKIFAYQKTLADDGGGEDTVRPIIPYSLLSMEITSDDPNDGGTWVYPDDYPELNLDPKHPTQYGGVIMKEPNAIFYSAGERAECSLEDGPENDAIVPWYDTGGRRQEAISSYNYIDVFDECQFTFIPMNSNDTLDLRDNEKFRFTPLYPDVLDENGKHAPIYPMNTIVSFLPDGRDSVTVTYTVKIRAAFGEGPRKGKEIPLDNPTATIKQICVQDTSSYGEQLENLFQYCNWSNPGQHEQQDLAPDYPLMYPYTNINGYEGLGPGKTPTTRGDDTDNAPLERGDIWYNPETEERKYYNIFDVPQSLVVEEGGNGYKDREGVLCVWLPPKERCYKLTDQSNIPFGLMCDIKTEKGKVVSATVSDTGSPSGWADGDIVAVTGGRNNARLKISIIDEPGWIDNYVEVF